MFLMNAGNPMGSVLKNVESIFSLEIGIKFNKTHFNKKNAQIPYQIPSHSLAK